MRKRKDILFNELKVGDIVLMGVKKGYPYIVRIKRFTPTGLIVYDYICKCWNTDTAFWNNENSRTSVSNVVKVTKTQALKIKRETADLSQTEKFYDSELDLIENSFK